MRRKIIWFLCVLLLCSSVFGQGIREDRKNSGRITGQVTEAATGNPIVGANILLLGTMLGAATDNHGRFVISRVSPSTYTILVSAIGYKKEEKTIHVLPEAETDLRFILQETVLLMDGIAVTASRYQQSLNDIPISLSLVPSQELTDRNITSVDHALRYVPGVNALDGGQVSIRGSSGFNWGVGSRVLVLLNGQPFMAGDLWNVNWYAIPTSNIKQIEVMKGSGSALYGSSAMGGVINIITEEPEEGSHIHVKSFTGFHSRPSHPEWRWTDSRNHFEGTAVDLSTHVGPVSTFLSSNYQTTTGYKENDDHQIFSFMANLGYRFNPNLRFDLMSGYGRNKGGFFIYWKDLHRPYNNGSDPHELQTRSTLKNTYVFPSIGYIINNRVYLSIKGRFNTASTVDHLQNKTDESPLSNDAFRSSTANTYGGEVQLNCQIHPQGIMVVGCDIQDDQVESIQFGHRQVSQASYYLQLEQRLWGRLKTTIGVRYDWEKAQEIGSTGELSRKLGLNLTLTSNTNLRFSLGEGFRTPAIGERFVSTFTSGLWISPNPSLLPERSTSAEVGMKQALGQSMNLDLAVFYTEYRDLIEPQLDIDPSQSVVVRFKNVLHAKILGLDLSHRTDWWSQLFSTRIGYTYLDTKDLSPGLDYGAPLKYRSKHTLYLTNDIKLPPATFGIDFRYLSQIERVDTYHKAFIKDIDKVIPTYVVALRFGISGEHLALRFIIDNLLQYNYLISPANMGPPRTAVLQLNVNY
jgi:outer membrane receptor for ferrienterochelin and colicins